MKLFFLLRPGSGSGSWRSCRFWPCSSTRPWSRWESGWAPPRGAWAPLSPWEPKRPRSLSRSSSTRYRSASDPLRFWWWRRTETTCFIRGWRNVRVESLTGSDRTHQQINSVRWLSGQRRGLMIPKLQVRAPAGQNKLQMFEEVSLSVATPEERAAEKQTWRTEPSACHRERKNFTRFIKTSRLLKISQVYFRHGNFHCFT